jgi:hypothetical protein
MYEPQPGDYACVWIPRVGMKLFGKHFSVPNLVGWAIRLCTWSRYCHAFVYIGGGEIIEAQPGGACVSQLTEYAGMPSVWSQDALSVVERAKVVSEAKALLGTPYGWLDLVAILFVRTLRLPVPWLVRRVLDEATAICSQLVAMSGVHAGIMSWLCGQPHPQLVTPGDLARRCKGK